jgi:hypothetical protein
MNALFGSEPLSPFGWLPIAFSIVIFLLVEVLKGIRRRAAAAGTGAAGVGFNADA